METLFDDVMVGPLPLNDNFSATYIDNNRWKYGELVREIDTGGDRLLLKLANSNPVSIAGFPYSEHNNLTFLSPSSVNSIQADVVMIENVINNDAYTRARLAGRWYNNGEGTPGSDYTGDIWAEVSLRGGPPGSMPGGRCQGLRMRREPLQQAWEEQTSQHRSSLEQRIRCLSATVALQTNSHSGLELKRSRLDLPVFRREYEIPTCHGRSSTHESRLMMMFPHATSPPLLIMFRRMGSFMTVSLPQPSIQQNGPPTNL